MMDRYYSKSICSLGPNETFWIRLNSCTVLLCIIQPPIPLAIRVYDTSYASYTMIHILLLQISYLTALLRCILHEDRETRWIGWNQLNPKVWGMWQLAVGLIRGAYISMIMGHIFRIALYVGRMFVVEVAVYLKCCG